MLKNYLTKFLSLAALLLGWSYAFSQTTITVDAPASIAGTYDAQLAAFGYFLNGESGTVVLGDDGTGVSNGCTIVNDMTGAIALVDRGVCGFTVKAANAQAAGAIALIVCNNDVNNPDDVIVMGGADCSITIPVVMISYNNCQTIKTEIANGVTVTMPNEGPTEEGQSILNPIVLPGAGNYTATELTGTFSVITNSVAAKVYSIVAPQTGIMNVNSCNGGADTRLAILQGCRNNLVLVGSNDDACDIGTGTDPYASSLDVIVHEGETYLIHWDDAWDSSGFNFVVAFGELPDVEVTFNVDMKNETVASDGVKVTVNGTEYDMTDNGDGTWAYTGSFTADGTLTYLFANGSGNQEDSPDIANCRAVTVGLTPINLPLVCYNSCNICPPDETCPTWISEDFEGYELTTIGTQSPNWSTWSNAPGGDEDAVVTDSQAYSGTQSLEVSEAGADDLILLLGDRTSGNFILKWKMYVPAGKGAYHNFQRYQSTPGTWATEVYFNPDGTGVLHAGAQNAATFTYPHDEWFDVFYSIDLDNDWTTMWVAGNSVYQWPISWTSSATTGGLKQLGSVDFFGNEGSQCYIDDLVFKQIESNCPGNALICDGFDGYYPGNVGVQSPWWTTFSLQPGSAEDGAVSSNQFLSCEQALEISEDGQDDVILLLGDRTSGNYVLSWSMYVPDGRAAYFNLQKDASKLPNVEATDFAIQVLLDEAGVATMDVGAAGALTFPYPHDQWFKITLALDVDNNISIISLDDTPIALWPLNWSIFSQTGAQAIGGVDFYGNTNNLFYVDDVSFVQLPSVPGNVCNSAVDLTSYLGKGQGTVTSTPLYDNTYYTTTPLDPPAGWECFGEPDGSGSAPSLDKTMWYTFVGDGQTYLIETGQCNSTNYIDDGDTQMAIYTGACNALTAVACSEDSPNAVDGNYFSGLELATVAGQTYYMMIDAFNFQGDVATGEYCINFSQLTGTPIAEVTFQVDVSNINVSAQGIKIRGSWNNYANENMTNQGNGIWSYTRTFFVGEEITYRFSNGNANPEPADVLLACGQDVNGTVYRSHTVASDNQTLPAVCFGSCLPCGEAVQVTFQVDMTYYLESNPLTTVRIAGNFADNGALGVANWDPPTSPVFTDKGDDVWSTTIEFPAASAGQNLEYKFLNTATSWGDCGVHQECMGAEDEACKNPSNDNRLLVIPSADQTVCFTWETCLGCNVSSTQDRQLSIPMTVAPNPFSNRTVVSFHNGIVNGKLRLSSLTGQVIRTYQVNGTQVVIEKEGLTPGLYFINVVTQNGTSVAEKLIIE